MASRRIEDLDPRLQPLVHEHIEACRKRGVDLLIYCTLRSVEEQAILFRRGHTASSVRTKMWQLEQEGFPKLAKILEDVGPQPMGPTATKAGPGQSFHNYGLAYDCCPLVGGKPIWDSNAPEYRIMGEEGKRIGLDWAGDWRTFQEFVHFQLPGLSIKELMRDHWA